MSRLETLSPARRACVHALATAALLTLGAPIAAHAQAEPVLRNAAFLILQGSDTLVVERVRRTASTVVAHLATRGAPAAEFTYRLAADHTIPEASLIVRGFNAAADAAPLQTGTLRFVGDSALLELRAGTQVRSPRFATKPGALPITNNDFVVAEQLARIALARNARTLVWPVFATAGGQTLDVTFERLGGDTARFAVAGNVTTMTLDASGNITAAWLAVPGLRIVVLEGAAATAVSLGRTDYSAPAGAPYGSEEVVVRTTAGHQLAGTLTRPTAATGRVPAVITITGSGAQDRDEYLGIAGGVRIFRQVADTLGRRGIAVLRLDDRGVGGTGGDVNGTSADFADDIRAAVAFLRARGDIDPGRIALVGHSEGGMIAPMVAATDPTLAAIVLMAGPAYSGREIIEYQVRNGLRADTTLTGARLDSAARAALAEFDSTTAKAPWMRFFLAYDPLPTIRRVRQPVLILHGATDQQVRPEEARILARELEAAGNRRVTLAIVPDRNHLFLRDPSGHPSGYAKLTDPKVDGAVLGPLADWLATTLRVR